ncbi:MAG: hypothetical protein NC043_05375 [Muribaculaceae bacterium]|nr:hypothetical protein [Muribaculaceae bacterium]
MNTLLIIIACICAGAAVSGMLMSRPWCAAVAFIGMVCVGLIGHTDVSQLIYWGVASALVWGAGSMLPPALSRSRAGNMYIVIGTVAGALIGVLVPAGSLLCVMAGSFLGALAYARTPRGSVLPQFPSVAFVRYLCASCLPAVVTVSIVAFIAFRIYGFYVS